MGALLDKIRELSEKKIAPSWFRSREWYTVEPAIRRRSFFSATIQSAKVLTRMQTYLIDWMTNSTEQVTNPTTGAVETVYKINGLAEFRERMTTLMVSEGLVEPEQVPDQRITNVVSNSRLALVFNTNREQSTTFARWQRNMSNPDWLRRFPAARFLRRPGAVDPRPLHVANEGQVRKWDDPFWLEMNNAAIGGFEVPWGPYGFNSYMVQDPVTRSEAEALKVIRKGEVAKPPDVSYLGVDLGQQFNAGLEANIDDVTPEIRRQAEDDIRARFGNGAIGSDGKPTLDALKRLRTQITTGVLPPPANVPAPAPIRTYAQLTSKLAEAETEIYKKAINDYESSIKARKDALQKYINAPLKGPDGDIAMLAFKNAKLEEKRLLAEYQKAIESAREAVSIPKQERGLMTTGTDPFKLSMEANVKDGYEIVQRYTNKDYLVKISIDLNSDDRAYHQRGTNFIKKTTDASVVAHEVTHATEQQNSELLKKAREFLMKRANGEKPQKLRKLTGNKQYKVQEIAYKDKWVDLGGDVYSGKDYGERATEILTMGIERLHADPIKFYRSDPEYFEFVVKTLQNLP